MYIVYTINCWCILYIYTLVNCNLQIHPSRTNSTGNRGSYLINRIDTECLCIAIHSYLYFSYTYICYRMYDIKDKDIEMYIKYIHFIVSMEIKRIRCMNKIQYFCATCDELHILYIHRYVRMYIIYIYIFICICI